MVVGAAPVCDDNAPVSPLAPQDILQQMPVLVGIRTVDLVIGGHDAAGIALPQHDLKPGQINFPQGTFVYDRIRYHAQCFLIVDGKMLGAGRNAFGLYAPDITCRHFARKIRIF